ncbi:fungal hydrophobin [Coniophora puteana RWD-64-598 SS2]|uniref:Hydrophobin n=1 Tax=Coniophora puteana (strain RWD-64-598) TaxID=741705 RepID=A0A5M3MBT7_CONPW|nr:fungal hydrophobin [Coniophora puteana RWD-64-598 SS2]EIW76517.1 fungal hydrophobin [Coniophora puteana RWD-64-598 SS2]
MFSRVTAVFVLALPLLAAAAPKSQCDAGATLQCCNSVKQTSDNGNTLTEALAAVDISNVGGQIGVHCTPISVAGSGNGVCNTKPVCCTDNYFKGLINVGCSPVTVNA